MARQQVDVLLFIEHVVRELDISCAVKYELQRRHGISLAIESTVWGLDETVRKYDPKIIALPYCHSVNDAGIRDIVPAWKDVIYLNLAYEQLFTKINQIYKSPRDEFAQKQVLHIAWGEFYSRYLQRYDVPEENIYVVGNPVYALYRSPYNSYFEPRTSLAERFGLDANKPWILVPENYGAAFYSDYKIQDIILSGISAEEAYGYREFARESFRQAVDWWVEAGKLGDVELIVRPRPIVAKQRFTDACMEVAGDLPPHFHIIKDGTVREWILASDVVMSSYSTTLVEAAVAKKAIYMIEPIPFPDYVIADWYDFIPKLTNLDEFMRAVKDGKQSKNYESLMTWAENEMMAQGDAINNIVEWIAGVYSGNSHIPERPQIEVKRNYRINRALRSGHLPFLLGYIRRVASTELRRLLKRRTELPSSGHENDLIEDQEINRRVENWASILS